VTSGVPPTGVVSTRDEYTLGQRNLCIPIYVRSVMPRLGTTQDVLLTPQAGRLALATPVAAGSTMNQSTGAISYCDPRTQDQVETFGGAPGDVFYERKSGTYGMIHSAVYGPPNAMLAKAGNNTWTSSWHPYECNTWPATPQLDILNTRVFTPPAVMMATSSTTSATLTGVTNLTAGTTEEQFAVGDRIFIGDDNPFSLTMTSCKIIAISASAGTITLAGAPANAGTFRINFGIRQPPANV